MKALILAGGFGTRLKPLTDHTPKSLLPIANVPFLEHQIRLLARHGVDDAILLTGYLASAFDAFVNRASRYGVRLEISTETEPLGTAGAVRSRADDVDDTFLVFNGDVLTDIDLSALMEQHRARSAAVTMALSYVPDAGGFGVVQMADDDRVTAFVQHPKGESKPGDWINAGIYAMEPEVIRRVPAGEFRDFERPPGEPLFPSLVNEGAPFFGYRSESYWLDIGLPDRYLQAHWDVLDRRVDATPDGTLLSEGRSLGDGTELVAPLLLSHAPVGAGARLGPYVSLGAGCSVGARAVLERAVICEGAQIGEGAIVRDSVIGPNASVEPGREVVGGLIA